MDSANPVTGQQGSSAVPSASDDAWRGTFMPPVAPPVRPPRPPHDRIWFQQTTRKLLRAPFTRDTWRQVEYAVLGLLLAIPCFVFIVVAFTVGLGMSLSFAGMLVGVPLLMVALLGARRLGAVHRRLAAGCWGSRSRRRRHCVRRLAPSAGPGRSSPIPSAGGPVATCCSSYCSRCAARSS